ncbi:MAG TPA: GGDEF domain-containing phosphodiesterase [Noviherbaspirillum sp.]|uniref:GGDEF domain-containing phosphodiesterase n=1 Tax=Noviherbaspirillum sp. TaxID=1926288 RepID=UPI002DDCD04F|nr:GGDEF domain-containing phosphodiesterase [Noviherbaspirillum sp.]HEV2611347.1 GGDEF domain-containing phosphodiesterase [Noviherbaspirillum sp.]
MPKEFVRRLDANIEQRSPPATIALLVVSLARSDRLEAILDEAGSAAVREELLRRVRSVLRESDYLAMPSSDEVWVALTQLSSPTIADLAASNLIRLLERPIPDCDPVVTVRPVIGVALCGQTRTTATRMLKAALGAQQEARAASRRYSVVATGTEIGEMSRTVMAALQSALAQNRLSLAYQPKVDLHTGQVAGIEALVRWPADARSGWTPTLLVDTAERYGMIGELTRFVVHTALREYVTVLAGARIGILWVNLSASMLNEPGLPALLQQAANVWGVPCDQIGLEVTESTLLNDAELSIKTLHALAKLGFSLAIDDFGTGYSSLLYLRRFPLVELKIDKLFVEHMASSVVDAQIVRAVIDLAHNFKLKVVAEGAEDEATLAILRQMGCDQVQGYVYSKPVPAATLAEWASQWARST